MKTLLALISLAFSSLCFSAEYREVVAFGDSLSDMGNRWVHAKAQNGKFRATWVQQLTGAAMLNVPGLKPSGTTSFYGGTNYAVGGATTEYTASMGSERNRIENLTEQISHRYLNPAFNSEGVRSEALHIIVIGTNDLMLASIAPGQVFSQWTDLEEVGVAVAKSSEGQIQALASAGVKHVLWGNLFNIAQAPSVVAKSKWLGETMSGEYLSALSRAAIAHNKEMDRAILRLEKANPSLKIIKLDLAAKFSEVASNPACYGFRDVTSGANDNEHLFSADGLHPTSQGHKMLAEFTFAVLSRSPLAGR